MIQTKWTSCLSSNFFNIFLLLVLSLPSIIAPRGPPPGPASPPVAPPPAPAPLPVTAVCNQFPVVFGANAGHSYLNQIDVYGDYLALAGDTNDKELTGYTSYLPYVAVMSLSRSGFFYWAKAFSANPSSTIAGAQFSTDSSLLLAHGYSISSFIAVFNGATGVLITSRGYQVGGYQNYNFAARSLLVGRGTSPMAYILSNCQTSTSCTGQYLFKITPLTFSLSAIWARKTVVSLSGNDCGHLGLIFGRSETFLYAFSWFNGKSTVTLLDLDGNSKWQQATEGGNPLYNNFIYYKATDSQTDMIVATSGLDYINYNMIKTSTIAPYSMLPGCQTYRDPSASQNRQIRGLFIQDIKTSYSIIFDTVNKWTDLATIDFSASKISYKRSLPLMPNRMTNGVFLSSTLYYVGSNGYNFYQDQSTAAYQYLNANYMYQAIVYSSVTVATSCYQMSTAAATLSIAMSTLKISPIKESIYQATTFSFKADTASSTTVDINVSKNTKLAWCTQSPFTINNAVAQTLVYSFQTNIAVQNLAVNSFSATVNCGGYTNTWTYAGVDASTGLPLNYANDLIKVDPAAATISVAQAKAAGTYFIKVIGTLPDLKTTAFSIFTIKIGTGTNTAPYFLTAPSYIDAPLIKTTVYNFPPAIDSDAGDTFSITLSVKKNSLVIPTPSFITPTLTIPQPSLSITPTDITQVGSYTVTARIQDNKAAYNEYQFVVIVSNQAPVVTSDIPYIIILNFGHDLTYNLPISIDPEGLKYTTSILNGPQYASIISNAQIRFNPTNCWKDLGNQDVYIKLEDEEPRNLVYSFTLFIENKPPVFQGSLPQNQTMVLDTVQTYTLPSFYDPEGCPVMVTFAPSALSSMISVQGDKLIFSPTQLYQVGDFEIIVFLTDSQGLNSNATFCLTIYKPPIMLESMPKRIDLMANIQASYSLPIMSELTDQYVIHSIPLPSFVRFNYPDYQFFPSQQSNLGLYTIQGQLWNAHASLNFSFLLNVTNEAPHFNQNQIIDQLVVAQNTIQTYQMPSATDREGLPIRYATYEAKKNSLPQFVRFNSTSRVYSVNPSFLDQLDTYMIMIDVSDSFGGLSSYQFKIVVYDPTVFLQPKQQITPKNNVSVAAITNQNKNAIAISIANISLLKVSRDKQAVLQIYESGKKGGLQELVKQISNDSFEISVSQSNSSFNRISYGIVSKDTMRQQIQVQLYYSNTSVSSSVSLIHL